MEPFSFGGKSNRMRGMTSPVEQIKDRLNIVDVISAYVKLDSAGKSFKGKSPFTNEKTPSFFVSPDKGLYHCFSTGKGGDMFTFIEEMEGVDFRGALKILADRAGVELRRMDPKEAKEKDMQYEILEDATVFFENELSKSAEAKKYLTDRGVEEKTIKEFRIGLAPAGWRNLYEVLSRKYSDKDMILAGLVKTKTSDTPRSDLGVYDTFRDRIMFPIMDTAGRPIAFSGRILHPDEKSAKYVNSPDTPLFKKSEVLFALNLAKNNIRKYNFTILAEGQFDVVMLHQAGFRNAVGVSGTALADTLVGANGVNNLGLVKRLSPNLILAFDADNAGIKAAKRSAEIALRLGMDVKVVSIPPSEAKDPADYIQAKGKDGFSALLKDAKHIIEFAAQKIKDTAKDERDLGKRIIASVLTDIAVLPTETEKAFFIKRVSEITGLDQEALWKDVERSSASEQSLPEALPNQKASISRLESIEKRLVGMYFGKGEDPKIKEEIISIIGETQFISLIEKFTNKKQELAFEFELIGEEGSDLEFREILGNLEEDYISLRLMELKQKIKSAESSKDDVTAENLAVEYQNLSKRIGEIKNKRYLHKF